MKIFLSVSLCLCVFVVYFLLNLLRGFVFIFLQTYIKLFYYVQACDKNFLLCRLADAISAKENKIYKRFFRFFSFILYVFTKFAHFI